MTRTYGWKPDLPDKRDRYHVARELDVLPPRVDHSPSLPPCWDQGSLGACTAFAIGGALVYERSTQLQDGGVSPFVPSFLAAYYAARELEGTTQIDAGAYIRDICKVAAQQGVAYAEDWPYAIERFAQKPPKGVRRAALDNRISSYARVRQTASHLRAALAGGDTIVCGVSVYESFDDFRNGGVIPMPQPTEDLLGGHAILLVGYDDGTQRVKFRNSWGTRWGDDGYGYLPYEYVLDEDLAADFWVVKEITP